MDYTEAKNYETNADDYDHRQNPEVFVCASIDQTGLSRVDEDDLRIVYWAAFYGLTEYVRWILVAKKWSPFIKSFKKRSILAATICGKKIETAAMILSYKYESVGHQVLNNR